MQKEIHKRCQCHFNLFANITSYNVNRISIVNKKKEKFEGFFFFYNKLNSFLLLTSETGALITSMLVCQRPTTCPEASCDTTTPSSAVSYLL